MRVRNRLSDSLRAGITIATYDETIRFNIIIVDDLCITQPYLPDSRGVDAPAFVMRREHPATGLYPVFEQVFKAHWERGRLL